MLLVIDIGNTNIVFALFEGEAIVKSWRVVTGGGDCKLSQDDAAKVTDVIVSSVVPSEDDKLRRYCREHFSCDPLFVEAKHTGLTIDLDKPEDVGADRLVNAVAVLQEYSAPAIVIDFGTATTFDVITAKGHYAGGAIAPGVNLSLEALERAAAKLPDIEIKRPKSVIGKNTVEAMQSGIYWGYVGLIEGLIDKITDEMGTKPLVIATGGLAPLFAPSIPAIKKVDGELTLKGLRRIHVAHKVNRQAA